MERVFWDDSYDQGHAIDALVVSGSIKQLITSMQSLENEGHQIVGLKVTNKGVSVIVSNE